MTSFLDKSGLTYYQGKVQAKLNNKVDVVSGKGLSTNDYTTDEKTKLSGIAEGATNVSSSTVSGWGYTKNTGTVTSVAVKMNDTTKGTVTTSGTIDLGTVITAHQDISGKVNKSGDTMTGQLRTSFKSAVAIGSYSPSATTIPDLLEEIRYSSGCMGSFDLQTAYTMTAGGTIAVGWYNFIYVPHRSGGVNGKASGDSCNYGTLEIWGMTVANKAHYIVRYFDRRIAESYPAEPTVNDATLTIQKNGTNVQTFTANSSSNVTANIEVPTNANIVDLIYPVGSIYMSVNSTEPSTLFGGTWEKIKDVFLLGAGDTYTAGLTGGEATHTLTVDEMPKHTHDNPCAVIYNGNASTYRSLFATNSDFWSKSDWNNATDSAGGGQAHNNMPPYLAVYIWKRTK